MWVFGRLFGRHSRGRCGGHKAAGWEARSLTLSPGPGALEERDAAVAGEGSVAGWEARGSSGSCTGDQQSWPGRPEGAKKKKKIKKRSRERIKENSSLEKWRESEKDRAVRTEAPAQREVSKAVAEVQVDLKSKANT